ncbi:MAG TPA: FAD-dependent oxidoreductase [Casimicrobiaceae bacterium]|jgi:succinate dehydrogenase/fumarate reductase flavoprotein subunit|nr:FAD-dependent oxidoreductase [Casimicrobiaceae bacterium]
MSGTAAWDETFDVVVLGSGAGGMTAALVATLEGQRTLLIEKSDLIGGTTALSSGTVWIPNNPQQHQLGPTADPEAARTYLDALVDGRADRSLRESFLAAGPEMIDYVEKSTDVHFQAYAQSPDYRQDLPGAANGGRPLEPLAFDGRTLGAHFDRVRWPLREFMLFGGMMVTRGEAVRLLRAARSLDAFLLGVRLVSRYAADRLRYKRGTRLVLGNALAARLYRNLLDRGVAIRLNTNTLRLVREGDRVCGLVVDTADGERRVGARRGIVLAGGGFPANAAWRERYLPKPIAQYTAACGACVGDTLSLAQAVGAALGPPGEDNALWFPSSIARRDDGTTAVYPHIALDRSKPGLVAVNAKGRRFVDEAVSYHEFVRAMYRSHRDVPTIPAVLVCDRRFVWKYGLGMIRPLTPALGSFIRRGYLHVGDSLDELARNVGVDPPGLAETVKANNAYTRTGIDPEFGKGDNSYDRCNGDASYTSNPCLGPIEKPPFCAVKVYPTPLGTSLGLRTDGDGRVLDVSGQPIDGLYACGNDMHSIMGGEYPGPGAQLGIAMTFGYLAAKHAAKADATSTPHTQADLLVEERAIDQRRPTF